jgi:hypothetical protein
MITDSASPVSSVPYEEENQIDLRATAGLRKEDNPIVSGRRIFKWFGAISSTLLVAITLIPGTFGIPENLQPWVFLTAVFWVLAFCAGMFDL